MDEYQVKVICNKKLLFCDNTRQLYYKKGNLYYYENSILKAKHRIIMEPVKYILSKIRLAERLLRLEPRFAVLLDALQILISNNGKLMKYNISEDKLTVIHKYQGYVNNPLNILTIKNAHNETEILYGEYWGNIQREPVSIYGMNQGKWIKKCSFPGGIVGHIHALVEDPYRKCILILTGDSDYESGIWRAEYDFSEVKAWVSGNQQYRSCVAFPVKEGLIYATDTPLAANAIYFLSEDGETEKLADLPGPCIYGKKMIEKNGSSSYVFATSVEGDSTKTGWKYRLSYRLGKGVKDRYTYIIKGTREDGFQEICKLKKDILPMVLFQFGNVQFPENDTDKLLITPISIKKYDGKTLELERKN